MKYLFFVVLVFFSFQSSAEKIWKPFGFELGGKFKIEPKNIIDMRRDCDGHDRCYLLKTEHNTFKSITVAVDENKKIQLIQIREGQNRDGTWWMTQPQCSDFLKDIRDIAVNKYNFRSTNSGDNLDNKDIDTTPDSWNDTLYLYKDWRGEKNNMKLELLCIGWYDLLKAELDAKWFFSRSAIGDDL